VLLHTYLSMSLPPVPRAARIILPPNEDTAIFILKSVQKTGVHMPPGKWATLVRLLWDSPPNQGPFYNVYREWTESGRARNIRVVVDALFRHYGDYENLEHPYPSAVQVLARRLSIEATMARAARTMTTTNNDDDEQRRQRTTATTNNDDDEQ